MILGRPLPECFIVLALRGRGSCCRVVCRGLQGNADADGNARDDASTLCGTAADSMTESMQISLKKLARMSPQQWEQLCDGCARCCLHKIEFEDTGEIVYTAIACRYLDLHTCRCCVYSERTQRVPTCHRLTPANFADVYFMPETCAYRLLAQGQPLPGWHPLVSGDPDSVHSAGISVRGRVVSESDIDSDDWPAYVIDWVQ